MVCQYSRPSPVSSEKHRERSVLKWRGELAAQQAWHSHSGDRRLLDAACSAFGQQPKSKVGKTIEIEDALEMILS
jgi:hypothetical protein